MSTPIRDLRDDAPMILRSVVGTEVLRINSAFEKRLGLSSTELASASILDWIHPEDRAGLASRLSEGEGSIRARHRTRSGDWLWFDWRAKAHGGQVTVLGLGCQEPTPAADPIAGGATPRSERSSSLDAMARIVEQKNPGLRCSILLIDAQQEYITGGVGPSLPPEYNSAVEGLRIGPAVGSCGTASFWNVPVVVENIATDPLWRDLRGAAALAQVSACWSHPIAAADGTVLGAMALYANEPCSPTQSQMDGLEIAAKMVGLSIERDRLEEQLRRAAKLEALGVLAGGIAHDFNNILAGVLGNAEIAMSMLHEQAASRSMLEDIVTASVSASELCNQLLAYAGRGARSPEILECNTFLRELGSLLQVAISKKATLVYDLQDAPLGILADRSQLRQVIMNLITNASESLGENKGRIVIGAREDGGSAMGTDRGGYVRVWIKDTGAGMDSRTQARIFDPFFSTKSSARGLGLAAVQGIVRSHRGTITLESTPGEGTTFILQFPREPLGEETPQRVPEVATMARGTRILVVDDEPQVRKVHAALLERAGHSVLQARDGAEAIDLFRRESDSIDCVLLDLSMPKLGGEEVFRAMREIRSDVRVVLCSGYTEQELMDRFRGAGLAGAVQKPARAQVLLEKLAAAMCKAPA